jgi:hypothetical protein
MKLDDTERDFWCAVYVAAIHGNAKDTGHTEFARHRKSSLSCEAADLADTAVSILRKRRQTGPVSS